MMIAAARTIATAAVAIMNLATSTGSWLAGPLGDLVSTPTAFVIAGCVQPLIALLVPATSVSEAPRAEPP
jgi:predicted MFS family arabinose efflux permease